MQEIKQPTIEQQENFGCNVEMNIVFDRHAQYDRNSGALSEEGKQTSHKKGEQKTMLEDNGQYIVKGYSSDYLRTQQTVSETIDSINTEKKGVNRVKLELGDPNNDFYIPDINQFLDKGEVQVDNKIITTLELAKDIAKRLDIFVRMSKKLKNNSKADLINVTHLPWILSFLKEVAGDEISNINPEGKNFVERIGGTIDFVEGFEVAVKRENKDNVSMILKFRDKEVSIPYSKLQELLGDYDGE